MKKLIVTSALFLGLIACRESENNSNNEVISNPSSQIQDPTNNSPQITRAGAVPNLERGKIYQEFYDSLIKLELDDSVECIITFQRASHPDFPPKIPHNKLDPYNKVYEDSANVYTLRIGIDSLAKIYPQFEYLITQLKGSKKISITLKLKVGEILALKNVLFVNYIYQSYSEKDIASSFINN